MKKVVIEFFALLFICFNSNAQIGITRNGQIKTLFDQPSGNFGRMEKIMGFDQFDIPTPRYLSKTRWIKMYETFLEFDNYSESWTEKHIDTKLITFNTTGILTKIETKELSYPIVLHYTTNKLTDFDGIKFIYDDQGYLSKIKFKTYFFYSDILYEYHFFWTKQGTIAQIKEFQNGNLTNDFFYQQILENGRKTILIKKRGYKYFIERDTHGGLTHWVETDNNGKVIFEFFYENKYDKNGNLIEQLKYEKKDSGKYYTWGHRFKYEYEFYE